MGRNALLRRSAVELSNSLSASGINLNLWELDLIIFLRLITIIIHSTGGLKEVGLRKEVLIRRSLKQQLRPWRLQHWVCSKHGSVF